MMALLRATSDDNVAAVFAASKLDDAQRKVVEAGMDYARAAREFRDAFISAYGVEAWSNFQDPRHKPSDHDTTLFIIGEEELEKARTARINQESDHASAAMPIGAGKIFMVKTKEGWFVDGATFVPPGVDSKQVCDKLIATAAAVRKYRRAIGKPDITPSSIDAELGLALDEIGTGKKFDVPHRFDIDKL
jgi:hypothetical protein